MANLVVISHSFLLAKEAINFAKVMTGNKELDYKIFNAAGIDENNFGTDVTKVLEIYQKAIVDEDVLVFHEIGSSLLSAETAKEMLDEKDQAKIVISKLPLVESLFVALNINNKGMKAESLKDILKSEIETLYS